mmetsp:Transcript_47337/g.135743  ORF Transcript_47337/g.135743 Transcript_47337/m.135743 type:complete len:303 (-) Transcript_47337:103-1011(-)
MLHRCVASNRCCPKVRDEDFGPHDGHSSQGQLYGNPFLQEDAALQYNMLSGSGEFPPGAMNFMYDPTADAGMDVGSDPGDCDELTDDWVQDVDEVASASALACAGLVKLKQSDGPMGAAMRAGSAMIPAHSEVRTASGAATSAGLHGRHRNASAPATGSRSPGAPALSVPRTSAPATPRGLGVHSVPPAPPPPPPRSSTSRAGGGVGFSPGRPPLPTPVSCSSEAAKPGQPMAPSMPGGGFATIASSEARQCASQAGAASIAAILQCVAQAQELPAQQRPNSEKWQGRFKTNSEKWADKHLR